MTGKPFFDSTGVPSWNKGTRGLMTAWNKGRKGVYSRKAIQRMRKSAKARSENPEQHSCWRGGVRMVRGYRHIFCPNHPFASANKCVPEHRLVMEKHLGRFLEPDEVIHHINQDTSDNRLENLMLFATHRDHMKFHAKHIGIKGRPKKQSTPSS